MRPDPHFLSQSPAFWANVRLISQEVGYSLRGANAIRVPTLPEIVEALEKHDLNSNHVSEKSKEPTLLGQLLLEYFEYRAHVIENHIVGHLMDEKEARGTFESLRKELQPKCPLPSNKQRGEKDNFAYLTCIVNMLVEKHLGDQTCDYDPQELTVFARDNGPLRTLSRRFDGAYPSVINPVAIWEVKEYYYTRSFGSRVADGVYETLLDGMELAELRRNESIDIDHLLIVDSKFTWWKKGKSYLCRIVDMLHMGFVDEVLFGSEVVERLPTLVQNWRNRQKSD